MANPFPTWDENFAEFITRFEPYIAEFPEDGPHRINIDRYRERLDLIRSGVDFNPRTEPYTLFYAAVMLLLDGRLKLTATQRKARKGLFVAWQRLYNSASMRGREGLDQGGPSMWSGVDVRKI
jgi:hypothetical protein